MLVALHKLLHVRQITSDINFKYHEIRLFGFKITLEHYAKKKMQWKEKEKENHKWNWNSTDDKSKCQWSFTLHHRHISVTLTWPFLHNSISFVQFSMIVQSFQWYYKVVVVVEQCFQWKWGRQVNLHMCVQFQEKCKD